VELLNYLEWKSIWHECYTIYSQLWVRRRIEHVTHQDDPGFVCQNRRHSPVFWDITPYSSLKINRRFKGTCHHHLQKPAWSRLLPASLWFLACLTLGPWWWRWHVTPKRRLTFNKIHVDISQKIRAFIITSLRISNLTKSKAFYCVTCIQTTVTELDRTEVRKL
jgi:hypothetical protein